MYHWLYGTVSVASQIKAIKTAWEAVGGMQKGELVQIDWEDNSHPCTIGFARQFFAALQAEFPDRWIVYSANWVKSFVQWYNENPQWHDRIWYAQPFDDKGDDEAEPKQFNATVWQWGVITDIPGMNCPCDINEIWNENNLRKLCGLDQLEPPKITNPTGDIEVKFIRRAENDMVLKWDGFVLQRADGNEVSTVPGDQVSVANKTALQAIISNNHVTGINPFDGSFGGYEDQDLALTWNSRPVAQV
jgi:hypothetical protein